MCNFHPLEVVGRGSETQLQVGENYSYLDIINKLKFYHLALQGLPYSYNLTVNILFPEKNEYSENKIEPVPTIAQPIFHSKLSYLRARSAIPCFIEHSVQLF